MTASLFVCIAGAFLATSATAARWFVLSDNSESCVSSNVLGYSICMGNLEHALNNLTQGVSSQDNVTLVLARGSHRLTLPIGFNNIIGLSIVAEHDDKQHVIINVTADTTTTGSVAPQPMVTFYSSRHLRVSNVTVVMLSEGTVFSFNCCQSVAIVNCDFVNSFGLSSAIFFTNTLAVDVHDCNFLFDVLTIPDNIEFQSSHEQRDSGRMTTVGFVIGDDVNVSPNPNYYPTPNPNPNPNPYPYPTPKSCPAPNSYPNPNTNPIPLSVNAAGDVALSLTNCKFVPNSNYTVERLSGYGRLGAYHTSPLSQDSLLQVMITASYARDFRVIMSDCYVSGLAIGVGVPVAFVIANEASRNSIVFRNSQIEDNRCISGCGILVLFLNNAYNNTIVVSNTTFTNNAALVEGGAMFALLEDLAQVEIANVLLVDDCVFRSNRADTFFGGGSAVMIYSNRDFSGSSAKGEVRRESTVQFNNCTFVDNVAERATVYTKDTDVTFTGSCDFVNNSGGAIYAYRSNVTFREGYYNFTKNRGLTYGGAISLHSKSYVAFKAVKSAHFISNAAGVFGGAIWVDITSSSEVVIDLHNRLSKVPTSSLCFIDLDPSLPFDYRGSNSNATIHFYNNTASLGGHDVYATTFRLCNSTAIAPSNLCADKRSCPVASSPYLLAFESASCQCSRRITSDIPLIHYAAGRCSRSVMNATIKNSVSSSQLFSKMKLSLECWRETASYIFSRAFSSGNGSLNMPDSFLFKYLWVPFGTCVLGSSSTLGLNFSSSVIESYLVCSAPVQPSSIFLNPAPGEKFNLTLNSWDDFLQLAPTVATMRVTYHSIDLSASPQVLLRHGGTEYGRDDGFSFNPLRQINDLSLAGPVNATGNLFISWPSYLKGFFCDLIIPFKLTPCHPGFNTPVANSDKRWTDSYIADSRTRPVSEASSNMTCTCTNKAGLSCSDDGKTVEVKSDYWAGHIKDSSNADDDEIYTHQCVGHCATETLGFATSTWKFDIDDPDKHCASFRTGVLCGECQANYSEVPASSICQTCQDSWVSGLVGGTLYTLIGGILFIGLSMKFQLLTSQYAEAWLFYMQTVALTIRPEQEYFLLATVAGSFLQLFGFCVHPHLTELDRLVVLAIPSVYLLFVVILLYFVSYMRFFSKYIQRSELMNTFLLVIIYAYSPLAIMACFTLSCRIAVGGDVRLFADPTKICFSDEHLPYAVVSIIILFAFLIPLPALLMYGLRVKEDSSNTGWYYRLSKLCASRYKSSREWWIGVTLWRRLFLSTVAALLPFALQTRQIIMFVAFLLVFFLSALVEPYKSRNANRYEFVLLANMCLLTALSISEPVNITGSEQLGLYEILIVVLIWPNVSILVIAFYKNWHNVKRLCNWLKTKCCRHCLSSHTYATHSPPASQKKRRKKLSSFVVLPDLLSHETLGINSPGLRDPLLLDTNDDVE